MPAAGLLDESHKVDAGALRSLIWELVARTSLGQSYFSSVKSNGLGSLGGRVMRRPLVVGSVYFWAIWG